MTAPREPFGTPPVQVDADPGRPVGPDAGGSGPSAAGGAAGPPPSERDIRPAVAWYWIGAIVLVGSVLGSFVLIVTGIVSVINAPQDYPRVSVPGERTVSLPASGTYFLYGESDQYLSGYGYSGYLIPPQASVADGSGRAVPVTTLLASSSAASYTTSSGFRGTAFARIDVPAAGEYTITTTASPVRDSTGGGSGGGSTGTTPTTRRSTRSTAFDYQASQVAVGLDQGSANATRFVASSALGVVGFIVGLVLLIVTAVRRNRSRKALFPPARRPPAGYGAPPFAAAGAAGYGAPPGYGPPPGYGTPPGYAPPPGYGTPPGYAPPPGYPPGSRPGPGAGAPPYGAPPPAGPPPGAGAPAWPSPPGSPGAPGAGPGLPSPTPSADPRVGSAAPGGLPAWPAPPPRSSGADPSGPAAPGAPAPPDDPAGPAPEDLR